MNGGQLGAIDRSHLAGPWVAREVICRRIARDDRWRIALVVCAQVVILASIGALKLHDWRSDVLNRNF